MYWPKLTSDRIKVRVMEALNTNVNYRKTPILGIPATYLDSEVFYEDAPFLENAPFLSTLIANPNHIGCHTLNGTEKIFKGTQTLERELIKLCAEQIFQGETDVQDGYIASGGTEANIEALWIYRNYFIQEYHAQVNEVGVIYSEDSHYSLSKGINILNINPIIINVDKSNRELDLSDMEEKIKKAREKGIKYFIVNMNMSTTMFGSVDDIDKVTVLLGKHRLNYKLHVDAAFGGFIYPFTNSASSYSFKNPNITSFTIDAHKMLQTPYGTGILLSVANLYSQHGTDENNGFFVKLHARINEWENIPFANSYTEFLKRCSDDTINAGIKILERIALMKDSKWVRYFGQKGIKTLAEMYSDREEQLNQEIKKLKLKQNNESELKTLEQQLVQAQNQKQKITTLYNTVKAVN